MEQVDFVCLDDVAARAAARMHVRMLVQVVCGDGAVALADVDSSPRYVPIRHTTTSESTTPPHNNRAVELSTDKRHPQAWHSAPTPARNTCKSELIFVRICYCHVQTTLRQHIN